MGKTADESIRIASQEDFSVRIGSDHYEKLIFPEEYPALIMIHQENPAQSVPLHYHAGAELIYSRNREVAVMIDGCRHVIRGGEFVLISPFALHAVNPSQGEDKMEVLSITLDADNLSKISPDMERCEISRDAEKATDEDRRRLAQLCEKLCNAVDENGYVKFLNMNSILFEILEMIFTDFLVRNDVGRCGTVDDFNQKRVRSILKYIDVNYCEELSTQMVAKKFGYTREYFCRLFKKYSGSTFKAYLTEVRLRSAVEEMHNSKERCIQIAVNNGFTDEKGFDVAFKKKFGLSPNQYRKVYFADK